MKIHRIFDLIMISILLVCAVLLTEFILMRMNINMTNEEAARRLGVPFDRRSTLEVVSDLRKEGKNAYPQIVSHSFEGRDVHPLGSISNVLTVVSNESGKYLTFESDEHGFRNPKGMYDSEIVIIGDSFAQGHSAELDVATVMRDKYRVLNLGMGSSGLLREFATLQEYAERPKIVFWFFCEQNDLIGMMSEKEDPILLRYIEDPAYTQGLKGMQDEIDNYFISAAEKMLKTKTRSYGFLGLRNIRIAFRRIGHTRELKDVYGNIDWDLFERILSCGRDMVDKLYFVYIPDYARFYRPELANPHREEILEKVRKLGIPIVDVYDVFMQYDDPLDFYPFRMRNHFNEKGYRVIAEKLLEALEKDLPKDENQSY